MDIYELWRRSEGFSRRIIRRFGRKPAVSAGAEFFSRVTGYAEAYRRASLTYDVVTGVIITYIPHYAQDEAGNVRIQFSVYTDLVQAKAPDRETAFHRGLAAYLALNGVPVTECWRGEQLPAIKATRRP